MNNKIDRIARTLQVINADSTGQLPKRIEVLKVGVWRTPGHGDFMITAEDLTQYVDHFNAGIGQVSAGIGLPIDFSHDDHKEAAGWMTKLYVEGESLMSDVEWSTAGEEALVGKKFKCFSPSFFPRGRGGWIDPEDSEKVMDNVLIGGGLTNIPLFKGLQPVMASSENGNDKTNVVYISASEHKENKMLLEDVVKKTNDDLSEEERTFLTENKDKLTDEQKTTFGFETPAPKAGEDENKEENKETPKEGEPVNQPQPVEASTKQSEQILADIKSGKVAVISTDELNSLKASQEKFETKEASDILDKHIARGAIKADQKDVWVKQLTSVQGDSRVNMEAMLSNLPDNKVMDEKKGDDSAAVGASATEQVLEKAKGLVSASAKEGKTLSQGEAISQVLESDKTLAAEYAQESKV